MKSNFVELHNKLYELTSFYCEKNLRLGQSMFIALSEIDFGLSVKLTGTEDDCFYVDDKICNFLKAINKSCRE